MPSRRTGTRGPVQRNPNAQRSASTPAPAPRPAAAPAPAAHAPAPAPAPMASSGGGIGGFVSNMAAATAGSVIGHTIAHGVLGLGHAVGGKDEAAPAAPAPAAPAAHMQEEHFAPNAAQMPKDKRGPCWAYQESLYKCMENNSELSRCSWAHDMLKDCKNQYKIKDV